MKLSSSSTYLGNGGSQDEGKVTPGRPRPTKARGGGKHAKSKARLVESQDSPQTLCQKELSQCAHQESFLLTCLASAFYFFSCPVQVIVSVSKSSIPQPSHKVGNYKLQTGRTRMLVEPQSPRPKTQTTPNPKTPKPSQHQTPPPPPQTSKGRGGEGGRGG